jgi:hypothetical protein
MSQHSREITRILAVEKVELVSNEEQLPSFSPVRFQGDLEHNKQLDTQASILFLVMHTGHPSYLTNDYAVPP